LVQKDENAANPPGKIVLEGKLLKNKGINLNALRRNLLIFLFFLLVSILLWFLTALNKDYKTVLSYPVDYIKIPKGKVLTNDVPEKLDLNVQARGFMLLRLKLQSRLSTLIFDVSSFAFNVIPDQESMTLFIITNSVREKIQQQLTSEIRIEGVSPDTLFLQLTDRVTKLTPVKLNLELSFEKQYMQVRDLIITPDSVLLSGPKNLVDTVSVVHTYPERLTGLKKNTELVLSLQPIAKIEFSTQKTTVLIPVEKFTEESIKVPIQVINIPDGLFLRTFPSNIEITYRVGLSDYNKVSEHMFMAVLDYSTKETSIGNKLTVELIKVPEYIQVTNFFPKNVEYIIEK
jgi:YbbR domain-containing protein